MARGQRAGSAKRRPALPNVVFVSGGLQVDEEHSSVPMDETVVEELNEAANALSISSPEDERAEPEGAHPIDAALLPVATLPSYQGLLTAFAREPLARTLQLVRPPKLELGELIWVSRQAARHHA